MMRHSTYTLRIEHAEGLPLDPMEKMRLQGAIQNAEDAVNDGLPAGYYCKIDESGEGVDLGAVSALEIMAREMGEKIDDQGR